MKNCNIRETPIDGKIIAKAKGGDVFTVTEEFKSATPIYLLKEKTTLKDIRTGKLIEKPADFKLSNVFDLGDNSYIADIIDTDKSIYKVYVEKANVNLSYSNWYYLKELNGWIYAEFCEVNK